MKKLLLLLVLLAMSLAMQAQVVGPGWVNYVTSAPSGACSQGEPLRSVIGLGTVYSCQSGTWATVGGGGSGTVTSVSFTGGLISVATPTTTPALTVAGTSGGIPFFSAANTWGSSGALAAGGVVLGGGAGTTPATNTGLTFSGSTLTVGLAGTSTGVLALSGTTSGASTITANTVAGTSTNPLVFSNAVSLPDGSTAGPALLINDAGFYRSTTTTWRWEAGGTDRLLYNTTSMQPVTTATIQLGATGALWTHVYSNNLDVGPNPNAGSLMTYSSAVCVTSGGITVLSTGATTTDTALNCLPANSIIDAVVYRITTTITTAVSFTIGDGTTAARFCATQSVMTSGTTGICVAQTDGTGATGPLQTSAAPVRVTTNANPGAGQMRLFVYYHTWTAPTS